MVNDLVIQVDPRHPPYSLFILFNKLTLSRKCFAEFYTHVSAQALVASADTANCIKNILNIFKQLKLNLNESRNNYDLGFTFVWKQSRIN